MDVLSSTPTMEMPRGNLIDFLFKDAHHWMDRPSLVCTASGKTTTYKELQTQVGMWATWLSGTSGLAKGAVVGAIAPLSSAYITVLLGTFAAGRVFAGLATYFTPGELASQLLDNQAQLLVVGAQNLEVVREAFIIMGKQLPIVSIGDVGDSSVSLPNASLIITDTKITAMKPLQLDGGEAALILYSSGTTGLPKSFYHSHASISGNVAMQTHPRYFAPDLTTETHQSSVLLVRPVGHSYGFICALLPSLHRGLKLILKVPSATSTLLDDIAKHQVTQVHVVPSNLWELVSIPQTHPDILRHLRCVFVSGAPIPTAQATELRRAIPNLILQGCYGLTEVFVVALDPNTPDGGKEGYTGLLLSNVRVRVLHPITAALLPPLHDGAIHVHTPSVISGFMSVEAAGRAAASITADGWFNTGDIGHVDKDGFIKIVDRAKELIKVEDTTTVSPSELENSLVQAAGVAEAAVVGISRDGGIREDIWAFLVRSQDKVFRHDENVSEKEDKVVEKENKIHNVKVKIDEVDEESIKLFIKERFNKRKHLSRVIFLERIPKNANGKVMKNSLRELATTFN